MAITSFMISSVPPPMRCRRASRKARGIPRLFEVAGAAPHLHARVDDAVLYLRAVLLAHRDLDDGILAVHHGPRGRVQQRARGGELGCRVGELVRDHLVLRDRAPERLALARVRDRVVEGLRRRDPPTRPRPQSRSYCNCHISCWKPRPGSRPMRSAAGTATSSSAISAVSDACMPSFSSRRDTETPGSDVSTMNSETPWCPASAIGLGDQREEVGARAVGDEHLAAVDAPHVAVAHGAGADRRRRRSRRRVR